MGTIQLDEKQAERIQSFIGRIHLEDVIDIMGNHMPMKEILETFKALTDVYGKLRTELERPDV